MLRLVFSIALASHAAPEAPEAPREWRDPLELFQFNLAKGAEPVNGRAIVAAHDGTTREAIEHAAERRNCRVLRQMGNRPLYILDCEKHGAAMIAALQTAEPIAWVEASWIEDQLEAEPNDLVIEQWHHHNIGQQIDGITGVRGADIGSVAGWDVATGSDDMVVAVLDTGIYDEHADLVGRLWTNSAETCGNRIDDDRNGYVDDCNGWDVGEADNDPDPRTLPASSCNETHATMMGGLIGANGNNGTGVTGVLWRSKLMNIKRVHDRCGASTDNSIEGSAYAIDNGAKILSIAFNGSAYSQIYANVLNEGASKGVIVVMSAGNDGENNDVIDRYPNNYVFATKLVVANTTNQDTMSGASNYGARNVAIAAPGADITSLGMDSPTDYDRASGTSFSQAIAAGAVGLVWIAHPSLTAQEIIASMIEGSQKLPSLDCARTTRCVSSGGRIDIPGALEKAAEKDGAFKLGVTEHKIDDTAFGDGDGALEAGEFAALHLTFANEGTSLLSGIEASLAMSAAAPPITLIDNLAALGDLDPGSFAGTAERGDNFTVEVAGDCAADTTVPLQISAHDASGRRFELAFDLPVLCASGGVVVTPPPPPPPPAPPPAPPPPPGPDGGGEERASGCSDAGVPASGSASTILVLLLGIACAFWRRR